MRRARAQAGFSFLEIIIAIAIVGILAAIVVPNFLGSSRKTKAAAEVKVYFTDLRTRFEQMMQETGQYPANLGEGAMYPAVVNGTLQTFTPPASWLAIRFTQSNGGKAYCGYTWVSGPAGNNANIGPQGTAFGFTAPATVPWYYFLAHCNMDGNAGTDSYYFASSLDPTIRVSNEGK